MENRHSFIWDYRVTILDGENLLLTWFRQSRQLVGRYCSHLLPRQADGIFQIHVNWRLSPLRMIILFNMHAKQKVNDPTEQRQAVAKLNRVISPL